MASNWKVEITRPAQAGLEELREEYGDDAYQDALETLLLLEEDRTPPESEHLGGTKSDYRIYLFRSLYRGIYRVVWGRRLVLVLRVGPRGGGVYSGYEKW